jgi:hypothetical protein
MIKQIKLILETIQDMDQTAVDDLFDRLTAPGSLGHEGDFAEKYEVGNDVMFIFPDGSLIGTRNATKEDMDISSKERGMLDRDVCHFFLYDYIRKDYLDMIKAENGLHPLSNRTLAKYFNIIIVCAGHSANSIYVPHLTEPTPAQLTRLHEFEEAGFHIEHIKRDL